MLRSSRIFALALAFVPLLISAAPVRAEADDKDAKKGPSLEEMRSHRQTLRNDLMVPSLKGLRGIAFGVAGHHPQGLDLDKAIESQLKQLSIPVKRIEELESGVTKPVDAVLQVKALKAGNRYAVVTLAVTQWCSLDRDPKIDVRTITYCDQTVTHHKLIKETMLQMVNQFVIDYQKANTGSTAQKVEEQASDDDKPSKKKKEKKDKKDKS